MGKKTKNTSFFYIFYTEYILAFLFANIIQFNIYLMSTYKNKQYARRYDGDKLNQTFS